ncbi:MAG TPA: CsbD family protein [Burkholderiaceae bacterium]
MNRDQVKGGVKETAGRVQAGLGHAIGDKEQRAKGVGKQVAGKVQKKFGDVKEAVRKTAKR